MNSYTYHDIGDEITMTFIRQHEPYEGYWSKSEQRALDEVKKYLLSHGLHDENIAALDLGCGEGRLIPWLANFSQNIHAVDPDSRRIEIAAQTYNDLLGTNVTTQVGTAENIEEDRYNLVMFSHILQHVRSDTIYPTLQQIYNFTKSGGTLILMYCKDTQIDEGLGYFFFDTIQDGKVVSTPISEEAFNGFVDGDATNGLPVHHIDPAELREAGEKIGWSPKFSWSFHSVQDGLDFRGKDNEINESEDHKLLYGRDIIEIWQKV